MRVRGYNPECRYVEQKEQVKERVYVAHLCGTPTILR